MPPKQYSRDKNGVRLDFGGMNLVLPADILPPKKYAFLQNVRRYLQDRMVARAPLGANVLPSALPASVISVLRLNDATPAGPGSGFALIEGTTAGILYLNSTQIKTGLSGLPLSFMTFRPNASPQPWAYIGDANGMVKVRSDGTIWKVGIAEPQTAAGVTFVGGGTGTTQIFYTYVYRSSVTGALSNPAPDSIPGTNSQFGPSETIPATAFATNYTFNSLQYEFNSPQLRTTGSVGSGVTTDFVVVKMGSTPFTVPEGVNIDGISVDLNWVGQFAGTGVLTAVSLYYLGQQIGNQKFPGIPNSASSTDAIQGGNADTWGATLTPDIINDPSFGFGVQITTQTVGGSDRSFINSMGVTVFYSVQDASIVPTPSSDPQVDKIDFYRQGGGLANFTYVGTGPNSATAFVDTLSDLGAATNQQLQFDNLEPFPSIDLPKAGVVNVAAGAVAGTMQVTWVSGDQFNVRWLPGTLIVIGGVAYQFYNRPTSATQVTVILPAALPTTLTNLTYNIAEPDLAAQPSPVIWGPTPDNAGAYYFGLDPLNTGDLVWSKGNNFDSAPDTNRLAVTSPAEPLQNGTITSELSTVFSSERFWLIIPNFADALATVTGTTGTQWAIIQSAATRGLYMRYAIAALGSLIFYRAKDGIFASAGGGAEKSVSDDIYNLFPHEGHVPQPVVIGGQTVFPPDDTKPNAQQLSLAAGYLYYDYQDTNGNPRTLVFDTEGKGWTVDAYTPPVNVHSWQVGQNINAVLVGCTDGTVRTMGSGNTEAQNAIIVTKSENGGDSRAIKRIGDVFLKAQLAGTTTIGLYSTRGTVALSGFSPNSITGSGTLIPYILDFTSGFADDLDDISLKASWSINLANILDLWQPDWIELPENVQDRPTDWDDLGTDSNKFIQGLLLQADSLGAAKTFHVEDELGNLHTPTPSPTTFNGQSVQAFSFATPFVTHLVRIVSTDGVPWRIWPSGTGSAKWIAVPYPDAAETWTTEGSDNGLRGWQHIYQINLAYIATQEVTVTVTTDQGNFSVAWPATGSQVNPAKVVMKCPPNKFKICSFSVTCSVPFFLWKEDVEVWIGAWGRAKAYTIKKPFGAESQGDTAAI
ncbi:MAG TPA: hypothetical protein VGK96_28285 [Candidatus Sulfotelmatobacter sp.]|jgi:hypothetical protein